MNFNEDFFLFCRENENRNVSDILFKLSKKNCRNLNINDVANQIIGLQNTKNKLPYWYSKNIIYPPKLSLEQSSSELTAILKSSLISKGNLLIDLTGGMGIDFSFLSSKFKESYYVERNKNLCEIASYNFKELKLKNYTIFNDNAIDFINNFDGIADLIYLDPARRDEKGLKVFSISECSPNIIEVLDSLIFKSKNIMIKFSPLLDISKAIVELRFVESIFIIGLKNECKELIFLLNTKKETKYDEVIINCINIRGNNINDKFSFTFSDENNIVIDYAEKLYTFLYEPNSTIMKGGGFKTIAKRFNLSKLHSNSHLYTSDILYENFPGRIFRIIDFSSMNRKLLSKTLHDIDYANVSVRNFPMKAKELQKKLNLKDGGNKYLFGTTIYNNEKIIIVCEKINIYQ